ncbi:MAG: hypothetical protein OEM02_16485 [Desulfobulbaceae bacterium]|nr:hypothetical protein [Desulfobulbaceae bacterium]
MLPKHLERTVNSNGGVVYGRAVEEQLSEDQLLERILSTKNISCVWDRVRVNKDDPGIDGITVEEFPLTFRECWPKIRETLFEGIYVPSPVLRVEIPKSDGGSRPLGIPTVLDRVIQQEIALAIGPIFFACPQLF